MGGGVFNLTIGKGPVHHLRYHAGAGGTAAATSKFTVGGHGRQDGRLGTTSDVILIVVVDS